MSWKHHNNTKFFQELLGEEHLLEELQQVQGLLELIQSPLAQHKDREPGRLVRGKDNSHSQEQTRTIQNGPHTSHETSCHDPKYALDQTSPSNPYARPLLILMSQ